ncbi:PQQ-binding-like beta-propeller repeat protein [Nocardia sp. NPDC127526]|uniref:outer membrane protein assembly factor BamB family protein n=1 Tax=Nocardia sp. NPDC127526 TaxID=3345393 RepID=UPI00363F36C6
MPTAARRFTGGGRRGIWIAVLIVAVVAGLGAVAWVTRSAEEPQAAPVTDGRFLIADRLDSTPVPQWTLRAADLSDAPGAVLMSMPGSLNRYYGYGSPTDAGTTIVAATAVPGEPRAGDDAGLPVGPVRLHGIDPATGRLRWTTEVGELSHCREVVVDGQLACLGPHRVLILDAASGAVLGDHTTDFEVVDVTVREGVVSVAGRTADRMTAIITRGTAAAIDAAWRRTYPAPVPGEPVAPGIDSRDYFLDGRGKDMRVYDLRTGDFLFTGPFAKAFDGGLLAVQVVENGWSTGRVLLVDRTGAPITEVANAGFIVDWYPTATAAPPPILTGESAYERTTGATLWTNARIGYPDTAGRANAIMGIVGTTVIVRSAEGTELTGLDLTDGQPIWQQPAPFANASRYTLYSGVTDATHLILTDGSTVHAIDVADGSTAWSMPLPPSGRPYLRTGVTALGGRLVVTTAHDFTGYAAA